MQKMITSSNEEGYANYQYQYQYQAYSNAHVSRSPSVVTDFPRYPNVHKIFNNKQVTCEDKTPPRRPHKKVHFVDQDKTTQVVKDNNENEKNVYGGDNSIDAKADGFIKQNHHKFELAKWEGDLQIALSSGLDRGLLE